MSVSKLMGYDRVYVGRLSVRLQRELLDMKVHGWEMEHYINWNAEVEGWCDNLMEIINQLKHVQILVAKMRTNTPESEDHIDGI